MGLPVREMPGSLGVANIVKGIITVRTIAIPNEDGLLALS